MKTVDRRYGVRVDDRLDVQRHAVDFRGWYDDRL